MTLDAKPAARFFSLAQQDAIKSRYGFCCAACGSRDIRILECDHWAPYNGENTVIANGVALCGPCNRAKSDATIPGKPLTPRAPVVADSDSDYLSMVYANSDAWADYCKTYRGKGGIRKKKIVFTPPY